MPVSSRPLAWITPLLLVLLTGPAGAAELEEAEALFRAGKYDECARVAAEEIAGVEGWSERWRVLKVSAEMQRGRYAEAMDSLHRAIRRFPASIPLRLLAHDVYRYNGRQEDVPQVMEDLERVVMGSPQRFATPEGRVALGRYFLLRRPTRARSSTSFTTSPSRKSPR